MCSYIHLHTTFQIPIHSGLIDNDSAIAAYDFENPIYQAEDEGEEDCEIPGELARLLI